MSHPSDRFDHRRPKPFAGEGAAPRQGRKAGRGDRIMSRLLLLMALALGLTFVALLLGLQTGNQGIVNFVLATAPWAGLCILSTLCLAQAFRRS